MFDEILADCLEALAKGATIRDCLTRYPAEAAALEPLLRLAVALSREGETRLAGGAFEQGRRRLLTAARTRQSAAHRQPRHTPPASPLRQNAFPPYQQNGLPQSQPWSRHRPRQLAHAKSTRSHFRLPRLLRAALVLLTIVSATTFVRQAATSLPGSWLYPVKNSSQRMVGVLMTAASEEVSWQANQLERRLTELNALTDATPTTVQSATQALEGDWQALLAASESLPVAERAQLIEAQIDRLQQFAHGWASRQDVVSATTVATVRKLIAAGETALATPTTVEETTTVAATTTATATATATATTVASTPTVMPTAPVIATSTALLQPSATASAAPILEPSSTPTPGLTLAPAPATPVSPNPTASPTPLPEITVQIPLQESSQQETDRQEQDDDSASDASAPTATSMPLTPVAVVTEIATVTPVVGTGPEEEIPTPTVLPTEVVATPTAADQPPTVTSGEGALPLPTKSAAPATATAEPVAPTARPTNQPGATKTPKATATQGNTEPATPNALAGTPSTPVERTPIATAQVSIGTKEAATETPVVAPTPTPRATTGGGEATKTPPSP